MKRLEEIANLLCLNGTYTKNIGFLNGKIGIAIFFYCYTKYCKNNFYEKIADELLEDVFENLSSNISIYFTDGLTGIGWGIEYLVRNKLVEGNTDDILGDIDRAVLEYENISGSNSKEVVSNVALYVISRLHNGLFCENKVILKLKTLMIKKVYDICDKELIVCEKMSLFQINSLFVFVTKMKQMHLFEEHNDVLYKKLKLCYNFQFDKNYDIIDIISFRVLYKKMLRTFNNTEFVKYYSIIKENNEDFFLKKCNYDDTLIVNIYSKIFWYSDIFNIKINEKKELCEIRKQARLYLNSDEFWDYQVGNINVNNMSVIGLAGVGKALINS